MKVKINLLQEHLHIAYRHCPWQPLYRSPTLPSRLPHPFLPRRPPASPPPPPSLLSPLVLVTSHTPPLHPATDMPSLRHASQILRPSVSAHLLLACLIFPMRSLLLSGRRPHASNCCCQPSSPGYALTQSLPSRCSTLSLSHVGVSNSKIVDTRRISIHAAENGQGQESVLPRYQRHFPPCRPLSVMMQHGFVGVCCCVRISLRLSLAWMFLLWCVCECVNV